MKPAFEQAPDPVEVAPVRRGATILHVNGTGQKHWGYWAKDPGGFFVDVDDEYWNWHRREGPEYWPTERWGRSRLDIPFWMVRKK